MQTFGSKAMTIEALLQGGQGFLFLHPTQSEIQRALADSGVRLPAPQPIFLEGEKATGLSGYLMVETPELQLFETVLAQALDATTERLIRQRSGDPAPDETVDPSWRAYLGMLEAVAENVTASDYGRRFPAVFWLYQSEVVARWLSTCPKRVLAAHPEIGDTAAAEIKYAVFEEFVRAADRTLRMVARRLAAEGEPRDDLVPPIFSRMRENVLIMSEVAIDKDLDGLEAFFQGFLREDGREFRRRWRGLRLWHAAAIEQDRGLRHLARLLFDLVRGQSPDVLLATPGYVSYLTSTATGYDAQRLLSPRQVEIWEDLLLRLRTFELFHNLRRLLLRVRRADGRLVCPGTEAERLGAAAHQIHLSPTLRPLDFMSPWVVDPGVNRSGLVYDLVHFTRRVSQLRDAPSERQESAFRAFYHLQRQLDRIAQEHRLYHEKYLGDGSFYTGRDCVRLLVAALRMQRAYRDALRRGFPFDDGMRIALNHGHYRLLPLGGAYESGTRYEIFGETVVELFRMVSGKSDHDLEEVASSLIARGYAAEEVRRFFEPLLGAGPATMEATPFRARLSRTGQLLNNGIVATESFLEDLHHGGGWRSLRRFVGGDSRFLVIELEDARECLDVAIRALGRADLKGLPSPLLFELVDGDLLGDGVLERVPVADLQAAMRALRDETMAALP
jgi:hypothetical protein